MAEENNKVYGIGYGKLYISGEYSILEDYSKAIILSVDKKVKVSIYKCNKNLIKDNFYNEEVSLYTDDKRFLFIKKMALFMKEYLNKEIDYSLIIDNELHDNSIKYGFGSSAALFVGLVKAIFNFYNIDYDNLKVFKIVSLFSILNNISGSMGDVASSSYGGIVYYRKFSNSYLKNLINNRNIVDIINSDWDGLEISEIFPKVNIRIIAKWTRETVDTSSHVKKWNSKIKDSNYFKFINTSNNLTDDLKEALVSNDNLRVFKIIKKIRENLLFLESISNIPMETKFMKDFIDKFDCGKQSGSGSGDMVLGFENSSKFELILDLN